MVVTYLENLVILHSLTTRNFGYSRKVILNRYIDCFLNFGRVYSIDLTYVEEGTLQLQPH